MPKCYAYIRVSTVKQAEQGVSLQEQKDAITRYAATHHIEIIEWFEECVTAAKQGRPLFNRMLQNLRKGRAQGVVIHKIDRSARNLRDWTEIGALVDAGVQVHFANESMDLNSRSGRLSADIQAVVAADYIRNLREEIRKGMYGRLKEGLTPFGAPLGYLNNGKAQPKTIDPVRGPLIRTAYELYASGRFTLHPLRRELARLGLRNRKGKPISLNGLSDILKNPFYTGLIRLKRTKETFPGLHEPIVSMALFKRVQSRLGGRIPLRVRVHNFTFRGLFRCALCGRHLVGELQKGHVYYRCQSKDCPTRTFREEILEAALLQAWPPIALTDSERAHLLQHVQDVLADEEGGEISRQQAVEAQLARLRDRQSRLVDAFLDGALDKETFDARKTTLLGEQKLLKEALDSEQPDPGEIEGFLANALELASTAQQSYFLANPEERRELALRLTSNRTVSEKYVSVEPYFPLRTLAKRHPVISSAPNRCGTRTLKKIARQLIEWAREEMRQRHGVSPTFRKAA